MIDRLGSEVQAKKITLEIKIPDKAATVMGTVKGLDTILSNLLSNAVKYTPEGGSIAVQVTRNHGQTQITVSDTGIGIPAADLERIGEEFFRAQNARRSVIIGTGLGLSIVKELVQTYGGTIEISSQENQGTIVNLLLPDSGAVP